MTQVRKQKCEQQDGWNVVKRPRLTHSESSPVKLRELLHAGGTPQHEAFFFWSEEAHVRKIDSIIIFYNILSAKSLVHHHQPLSHKTITQPIQIIKTTQRTGRRNRTIYCNSTQTSNNATMSSMIKQAMTMLFPTLEKTFLNSGKTLQQTTRRLLLSNNNPFQEPHLPGRLGLALAVNRTGYHPRFTHSWTRNLP
mmetsp:Transcript_18782/g.37694  ORF Transcript_18782/g.37694 Transcript_18782/m.37694 type:complete len:195 (+) Transcript_18782:1401-1985(+)